LPESLLRQPPNSIPKLIGCPLVKKVNQTITHLPSQRSAADLALGDKHDASMLFSLGAPFVVDRTEVASWIAIVAGNNEASLICCFLEQSEVINLNRWRQVPCFGDVVSVSTNCG